MFKGVHTKPHEWKKKPIKVIERRSALTHCRFEIYSISNNYWIFSHKSLTHSLQNRALLTETKATFFHSRDDCLGLLKVLEGFLKLLQHPLENQTILRAYQESLFYL